MNSIRIVYAKRSDIIDDYFEDVAQRLLSPDECARLSKYENKSDRQLSLLGKLLLFLEIEKFGIPLKNLTSLRYNAFEKPIFNFTNTNVQFNISHSGDIAVVAVSINQHLGIDIEHTERSDLPEPASIFTDEEQRWIQGDTKRFLTLWTRKEAVLKAAGKGLYHDIPRIDVTKNAAIIDGHVFHLQDVEVDTNYACAIAFEKKESDIMLTHTSVDHLFMDRISRKLL